MGLLLIFTFRFFDGIVLPLSTSLLVATTVLLLFINIELGLNAINGYHSAILITMMQVHYI